MSWSNKHGYTHTWSTYNIGFTGQHMDSFTITSYDQDTTTAGQPYCVDVRISRRYLYPGRDRAHEHVMMPLSPPDNYASLPRSANLLRYCPPRSINSWSNIHMPIAMSFITTSLVWAHYTRRPWLVGLHLLILTSQNTYYLSITPNIISSIWSHVLKIESTQYIFIRSSIIYEGRFLSYT